MIITEISNGYIVTTPKGEQVYFREIEKVNTFISLYYKNHNFREVLGAILEDEQ